MFFFQLLVVGEEAQAWGPTAAGGACGLKGAGERGAAAGAVVGTAVERVVVPREDKNTLVTQNKNSHYLHYFKTSYVLLYKTIFRIHCYFQNIYCVRVVLKLL